MPSNEVDRVLCKLCQSQSFDTDEVDGCHPEDCTALRGAKAALFKVGMVMLDEDQSLPRITVDPYSGFDVRTCQQDMFEAGFRKIHIWYCQNQSERRIYE